MVAGGEISYSIYLLHPFLLSWFVKPELSFSVAKFGLWMTTVASASAAVIVMSFGTWSLIEVPCRRWLRDTLRSNRPAAELADLWRGPPNGTDPTDQHLRAAGFFGLNRKCR
jgi:peptidoglycan/LPS O-acetylase OafA/YrhL